MNFDFAAFLMFASLGTGAIWALDRWLWQPKRLALLAQCHDSDKSLVQDQPPILIEYARSFFPVLLFVFLLRSFWVEPYRIPSGSMKPSLLVGDFILVNKYAYGVRLPVFHHKIVEVGEPQRGDVMVFRYPVNPAENFIKRVIGVPGDRIDYRDKQLFINGERIEKTPKESYTFYDEGGYRVTVRSWLEQLGQVQHGVYERLKPGREVSSIVVPPGHYFMMGDNRDDSDDSRAWGFVPEENIVGKAIAVWMSWDAEQFRIRFDTIPRKIV